MNSIREVRRNVEIWAARLGLAHWRIAVRWATRADVWEEHEYGQITWYTEEARAEMVVRRGSGLPTILHELIHLTLEGSMANPIRYDAHYERGINAIVAALLA